MFKNIVGATKTQPSKMVFDSSKIIMTFDNTSVDVGLSTRVMEHRASVIRSQRHQILEATGVYKGKVERSLVVPAEAYTTALIADLDATNQECILWLFNDGTFCFGDHSNRYQWHITSLQGTYEVLPSPTPMCCLETGYDTTVMFHDGKWLRLQLSQVQPSHADF